MEIAAKAAEQRRQVVTSEPGGQAGPGTGDPEPPQDGNQAARDKGATADDDGGQLGTELGQPDAAAQETNVLAEAQSWGQAILATERIDRTALYSPTALAALAVVAEHDAALWARVLDHVRAQRPKLRIREFTRAVGEHRKAHERKWRKKHDEALRDRGGLPTIIISGRQLRDISDDTLAALRRANDASDPPQIYVRGAQLTRVRRDEDGGPITEPLTEAAIRGQMGRAANFFRLGRQGCELPALPPLAVSKDILALDGWPGCPALTGLVEAPVLRPDGSVLVKPGYDPATRLLHVPALSLRLPPIPEHPTPEEVQRAVDCVLDLLVDFPFVNEASRANCFALFLTIVLRPAIDGCVPLVLLDKPSPGTGASLITTLVGQIAAGRAGMLSAPQSDEEWRKMITSALLKGGAVQIIDNVEGELRSPSLAKALTLRLWEDRELGGNRIVRLPQYAIWMATGNNLSIGGDLPRRCCWVRMNAGVEKPWLRPRDSFTHPDLEGYAKTHRGDILAALLTICRGWVAAGRPKTKVRTLGGFDEWAETLGSVLDFAGVQGFLGNLDELYDQADSEGSDWQVFLTVLREVFAGGSFTVADIVNRAHLYGDESPLRGAVPSELQDALAGRGSFAKKLGKALSRRRDQIFSHQGRRLQLVRLTDDPAVHAGRWQVRELPR